MIADMADRVAIVAGAGPGVGRACAEAFANAGASVVIAERTGEEPAAVSERLAETASLRTHVDPVDIAEAVLFLCSARGRCITGVDLPVNAGQ